MTYINGKDDEIHYFKTMLQKASHDPMGKSDFFLQ